MNGRLKIRILSILLLLASHTAPAQELPKLPKAPEINVGKLQNGAEYYLVKNSEEAGYAEFALVRQIFGDGQGYRDALPRLPHFSDRDPVEFLSENGIGYGPGGFVSYNGCFETLRLSHVPVYDPQVCDSTLLLVFDMMSLFSEPQAIAVCGDIDVEKIRERSNLLSLMASSLPEKRAVIERVWEGHDILQFTPVSNRTRNTAVISLEFKTRRTSSENMNTVLPVVTGMYSEELGRIIEARLLSSFRKEEIPISGVRYSYKDSASDSDDERFVLSLAVPADRIDASMRLTGSVLGTLDRNGSSRRELLAAMNGMTSDILGRTEARTNPEYMDKCLNSYMYGADLASERQLRNLTARRRFQTENELQLFNDFASALLDPEKNLSVRVDIPCPEREEISMLASFRLGWTLDDADEAEPGKVMFKTSSSKVRLTGETADPVSGGIMWTFSNGMKVIFREADTPGEIKFALLVNGGYPAIHGTGAGEAVFVDDMFPISTFNGIDRKEFMDVLSVKGITVDASVSMSSFRLSGSAPSSQLQGVVEALLTMSSGLEISGEEFRYYVLSEDLSEDMRSMYPRDMKAISDSILCPGYWYLERKYLDRLGIDFNVRAADYFKRQLSRTNDGVLVLIGDLQPDILRKELPKLLGGFGTARGVTNRPKVNYPMISGTASWVRDAVEGQVGEEERGVYLCMSSRQNYDNRELMAFRIAVRIIRKEFIRAMKDCGYHVGISGSENNYPKGTFTVHASFRPCAGDGLPPTVAVKDPLFALSAVRNAMEAIPGVELDKKDLKAFKAVLESEFSAGKDDPEEVIDRIEARYCQGKDLVSGAKAAIEAVTEDDVRKMLSDLVSGARVEYVIL